MYMWFLKSSQVSMCMCIYVYLCGPRSRMKWTIDNSEEGYSGERNGEGAGEDRRGTCSLFASYSFI